MSSFLGVFRGWWFLWAYIVLMCFAPMIDAAFENRGKNEVFSLVLPILAVTYGWMFVGIIPGVRPYVPMPSGFGGMTFLSLIGIYLAVRLLVTFEYEKYMGWTVVILSVVGYFCLGLLKLWHYWWLPSLFISASLFWAIKNSRPPSWVLKVGAFLSPSMLSVYLLHMSSPGLMQMRLFESWLIDEHRVSAFVSYLATALMAMSICVFLDIVRRLAVQTVVVFYKRAKLLLFD